MKNKKQNKTIINIIFIIIFFILIAICNILVNELETIEEQRIENRVAVVNNANAKTIKGTIEKHDSKFLSRRSNTIYVEFSEDLYDESGNSNEQYFESMIKDISKTEEMQNENFSLIDEEKDITIHVKYNAETEGEYSIEYNGKENFYEEIDAEEYTTIDKAKIVEQKEVTILAQELRDLSNGNMFFRKIKNDLGIGKDLGNGYTSFKDGALILKLLNSKVRNIVFTEDYTNEIVTNVTVGMSLAEIKEQLNESSKENTDKDYLLYRTSEYYLFFYEDEVSVYSYSYFENTLFEQYLEEYLEDKNLDSFIKKVTGKWAMFYDKNEYNIEQQYAYITFPSIGVEINIENNDPKGITLYNNYYFTEKTRAFAKDGKITINADEDLLEKMEQNRRNEFLEVKDV